MPWRRMRLRNAEVLARCDESGELVSKEGRVEIRYKPNDGRAYFASSSNLRPSAGAPKIEPDSFCGPGEAVKKTAAKREPAIEVPDKPEGDELLVAKHAPGCRAGRVPVEPRTKTRRSPARRRRSRPR